MAEWDCLGWSKRVRPQRTCLLAWTSKAVAPLVPTAQAVSKALRIKDAAYAVRAIGTVALDAVDAGRQLWQSGIGWVGRTTSGFTGSALARASNVVALLAPAARAVTKVLRVGGPAGAVLTGAPDAWDATRSFWHEGMASTEGWRSVGKGTVRVTLTVGGAAAGMSVATWIGGLIGTAFLPGVGTAVGAVVGSVVGSFVADLINNRF